MRHRHYGNGLNEIILGRKVIDWKGNDNIYTECFKKELQKHQNQINNPRKQIISMSSILKTKFQKVLIKM